MVVTKARTRWQASWESKSNVSMNAWLPQVSYPMVGLTFLTPITVVCLGGSVDLAVNFSTTVINDKSTTRRLRYSGAFDTNRVILRVNKKTNVAPGYL